MSRASHPWHQVVACKSQNLELVSNWWVFCCSLFFFFFFLKCVIFIYPFLIWTLSRKLWLKKDFIFEKHLIFWSLEVLKLKFKILRLWKLKLWDLKIWNLKLGLWNLRFLKIWNLKFWKIETWDFENLCLKFWSWNLRFEILKTECLDLKIGHWECGVL